MHFEWPTSSVNHKDPTDPKEKEILDEGYPELFKLMVKGTGVQIAKSAEDIGHQLQRDCQTASLRAQSSTKLLSHRIPATESEVFGATLTLHLLATNLESPQTLLGLIIH